MKVSVVIPARDAATTLAACLRGALRQNLARDEYEVIVIVDSRTRDQTAAIARACGAEVVERGDRRGAGACRNAGIAVATGEWIAFTDADCLPTRGWLKALLDAVTAAGSAPVLGAAGVTIGFESYSPAARFVDISGGLRADRSLAHPTYPWAPTANVLYRRDAVLRVGGFDTRFVSYEAADLHTRLSRELGGEFRYAPAAVVNHRHRRTWREYWRQQVTYGRGYAQFYRRFADELPWTPLDEARAWLALGARAVASAIPAGGDGGLLRHGTFVKQLAQRVGFATTYWSRREATRWRTRDAVTAESAP